MARFLVLYLIPAQVMDGWAKTDPQTKKTAEDRLRGEWERWTKDHAAMIQDSAAAGATKKVTSGGSADARNDLVMYSFVEAESHEAAAEAFEGHPHLQIPQASIEIMPVRPLKGP